MYANAYDCSRVSALICNKTILASNHRCKVLCLIHLSSPSLHFSDMYWRVFSLLSGTWLPHCSHLGRELGCFSRILILSPQFCMLRYKHKKFHMGEDPGHLGKGQGHLFVAYWKPTSYNWVWCTVWLTGSRLKLITGSVP